MKLFPKWLRGLLSSPVALKKISVSLPFSLGSAEWELDNTQRRAAWCLYVELVTRIAMESLGEDEGLLREALNSLYSLFGTTREILKIAGPDVGVSLDSVGGTAINVLNKGLRPFLTKWHPRLQVWEAKRPSDVSFQEYEQQWTQEPELRQELANLRSNLYQYALALADIAEIEN